MIADTIGQIAFHLFNQTFLPILLRSEVNDNEYRYWKKYMMVDDFIQMQEAF